METIQKHFNKPQLRSFLIDAPSETFVAGRATGKTVGPLAKKTSTNYAGSMPRGKHVIVAATFTQAFTRTLTELMRGWEMLGYKFGVHYLVGTKPTEKWIKQWNWKGPYAPVTEYKYFIPWWNGSVFQIISQERVGSSNGISIDSISGDEAKLLNEEKFRTELVPANRGIIPAFQGNPNHHGVTLTTDMPVGTAGRWILDRINSMDRQKVNDIWQLQTIMYDLKRMHKVATAAGKKELEKQFAVIDAELKDIRRGLMYYHEATTIDNIHALGLDYIKQQLRDTSPFQFDTQILNIRPLRLQDGFYPDFDENFHGYFKEEESYFDNGDIVDLMHCVDCRKDGDLDSNAPLHIALDYNRRIHPIVVGQDNGKEIRILNALHALYPGKLKEALRLFCDYYKPHKEKTVYYWYDHTAVGGENETAKCDDVDDVLSDAGWTVIRMYIGKAPGHETKYNMYGHLFQEDAKYPRVIRFNRENCRNLLLSIGLAEAEQRRDGFGKSKKTEHDEKFPAEESTHYSDALDMVVYGMLESGMDYTSGDRRYDMIMTR